MDNFTIVIPFYKGQRTLDRLIRSLPRRFPIIIVDDAVGEGQDERLTQEYIDKRWEHPDGNDIQVIQLSQKGYFAGAVNRGIQECETDVLVLNQDIWFDNLAFISAIESLRGEYAFFGERIRGDHPAFGEFGYVHGTFMFLRRDVIRKVGVLNQLDYPLWGNTAEYQWRVARAGFKVKPLHEIPGMHHERPESERYGSGIRDLLEKEPGKKDFLIKTPPLLSVIVPCYNYGHYIQDCINSLIGGPTSLGDMAPQSLQSFEIIIVDDASTDSSPELIAQVADITKGIRAYRLQQNVGTAQALNFAIKRAVGKYITFLSADDMRENFSLQKLVEACEQNPHSFAYDDVWLVSQRKRIKQWEMEEYDFEKLLYKNHVHAGIVYPRIAWEEVGGYPAVMNDGREDWAFNVALGIRGWCGVHVKQFGYLYRREGQNRTETNSTEPHQRKFSEKMMNLFPAIYRGERPMPCCGKGNKGNTQTNMAKSAAFSTGGSLSMARTLGTAPMERIEYTGDQVSATWTGDVTGAEYVFGRDRPRGWVDKRDVGSQEEKKGFLSKKDKAGRYIFKLAPKEVVTNGEPVPEPVSEPVGDMAGVEPVIVEVSGVAHGRSAAGFANVISEKNFSEKVQAIDNVVQNTASVSELPDPDVLTVDELKGELAKLSQRSQWEAVYRAELAGRKRRSAVYFIEARLANWES